MNKAQALMALPLFPLLAFLVNGALLKTHAKVKLAGAISFIGTFLSFLITCYLFSEVRNTGPITAHLWEWALFSDIKFHIAFLADQLSVILLFMVTGIGSLITLFSIGYMDHDPRPGKFFTFLSLFIFSMLLLTLGENFLVLFFGWEGVGLASYLLIGFWYEDIDKAAAGRKAFIANRVGDFGFVLGMIGLVFVFKSLSFTDLKAVNLELIREHEMWLTMSSLFLVLGVTGKSAQVPLYVWLPDAMAGPTPVSALIHAATMVTAGIFLLCRLSPVIAHLDMVLNVIAFIGAITAFMAALIAITQRDIKKVLAYSTVSQIGYMMLACGVGAFSTGMFHVFTHAFFKALLFLGAGAVIYSLHHQQDMMKMGGLKAKMPVTFWCFVAALLAICGVPGFAGFFSKDEILWMALNRRGIGIGLYVIGLITAMCTAFYMTRLVLLTFLGTPRYKEDPDHPIQEAPWVMRIPLIILAIMSVFAGYFGLPHFLSHDHARGFQIFLEKAVAVPPKAIYSTQTEHWLMAMSVLLILLSMGLAYFIYIKKEESQLADKLKYKLLPAWNLSFAKFKVDEFYEIAFLRPIRFLAKILVNFGEKWLIDGPVRFFGHFFVQGGTFLNLKAPRALDTSVLYLVVGVTAVALYLFALFK